MRVLWCIVVGMFAGNGYCDDWPVWRGPAGNGISAETQWSPEAASILWKKELGVGYSSVSVVGGKLYTMGHEDGTDTVYCLHAKTGKKIWDHSYSCKTGSYKGPRATPVVDGSNVYTVSREGQVICFEAESGAVKWETDVLDKTDNDNIRWGISSSAVIEGELLLLNIGSGGTALNKNSGDVVWKSSGAHSYASPVVFDHKGKRVAAIFSAPGLHIVDVKSGKAVAEYEWKTKYDINGADPLVIDDRIFISSGYGHGCAMLDFSSGKLKKIWENDVLKNHFSSSIFIDGYIYGVDGQTKKKGFLRCIDAKDGAEVWSMPVGFGSLIAAGDRLIVLGEAGTLYFADVNPEEYKELSKMETGLTKLCWTPPALADGIIYCRNDKGTLVAVDAGK